MSQVLLDRAPPIARVTLNRPEVVNATDGSFLRQLLAAGRVLAKAKDIRAVLITGAGRGFCSGIDLKALERKEIKHPWFRQWEQAVRTFETLHDKAVICGIHGACIGGGLQLTLAADLRIASEDAFFGLTAIRHSIIPGLGTFRLPRAIGLNRARRLALVAERIDARTALEWGLVDRVVPRADLGRALDEAAAQFLETSPTAFRESKKVLLASFDLPYRRFVERYLEGQRVCLRREQ